jgi:hypothetical protein
MKKEYINEKGQLHREDGPARFGENYEFWYINGKLHREDGPAYINGYKKIWYINGKRHCEDGPAFIYRDLKAWYINDKRHREDGPAFIFRDRKEWWIHGKLHREDGPAVINGDLKDWWYIIELNIKIKKDCELWWINNIERNEEWVKKYLKIKNKHMIAGIGVSDYWKIREVILRWRYNPALKCVKNRLKREFNSLNF